MISPPTVMTSVFPVSYQRLIKRKCWMPPPQHRRRSMHQVNCRQATRGSESCWDWTLPVSTGMREPATQTPLGSVWELQPHAGLARRHKVGVPFLSPDCSARRADDRALAVDVSFRESVRWRALLISLNLSASLRFPIRGSCRVFQARVTPASPNHLLVVRLYSTLRLAGNTFTLPAPFLAFHRTQGHCKVQQKFLQLSSRIIHRGAGDCPGQEHSRPAGS